MKERNWKYKITGNWFGPMVIAITTAVSGGFTFWLYTAHDGAFVGLGGLTAFFAIICVLSAYGAMSFKLLVDKDGFYFRTKPGNGRYYRYSEICSMWLSSGRETDTQEATYCNFETIEGKRSRFLVLDPHLDAVDYMIERVEAVGSRRGDDDFDREIVITGKTESVVIIILVIFGFPILYLMLFGWTTMPLIFRMIPVAILLFSIVRAFSHGLFYIFCVAVHRHPFPLRRYPPVQFIENNVGQQWRENTALRCPFTWVENFSVRHHDWGFQHFPNNAQKPFILNSHFPHLLNQLCVVYIVKEAFYIDVHNIIQVR